MMPPLGGKGKGKGREARRSRSRNTTPSSVVSAGVSIGSSNTAYLDSSIASLMVPTNITYDDILERHGGGGGIPDPKHLEALAADLKILGQLAETRGKACDKGMRELAVRRKERLEGEREKERATHEAEEKEKMKREAEEVDARIGRKGGKLKKSKDRSVLREERPLTHGAHGLARQDGMDTQMTGKSINDGTPLQMLSFFCVLRGKCTSSKCCAAPPLLFPFHTTLALSYVHTFRCIASILLRARCFEVPSLPYVTFSRLVCAII